jgi:transmembrane sensor
MNDDTLYSRWLEGKLTEEEKKQLEESGDDAVLKRIVANSDTWSLPDLSSDLYSRIIEKREKQTRVIKFNPIIFGSIAAAFAILVFVSYQIFFQQSQEILGSTKQGEINHSVLPDGNHVHILSNSSLSYSDDFTTNKEVESKGLVYFDIIKKGPFMVHTVIGDVSVKGTRFDVLNTDSYLTVTCYEGLVECKPQGGESYLLTPGKSFSFDKTQNVIEFDSIKNSDPEWLKGSQSFRGESLKAVLETMEVQFAIQFKYSDKLNLNRNYSGKYYLNDTEQALQSVFAPLGINYTITENDGKKIVTLQ